MVLKQLQLKWPNHSTQLLTGLKYLFKNEQLVDCTLKCNKHTLKVHRSVLAACSPYFERELENNPLIVIKDMQFNVLQALIEFMYYGETRITEENLTSLIEAAKLFEIKGLSEMDLLTSSENSVVPSVVAVKKNCAIDSSFIPENINDVVFENGSQTMEPALKSPIEEAISINVPDQCLSDGGDSNSNLVTESTNSQSHSSRNFVITPPQTESAQILLSLACSYSQKQYLNPMTNEGLVVTEDLQNGNDEKLADHHHNLHSNLLFDEPAFILPDTIASSSSSTEPTSIIIEPSALHQSSLQRQSLMDADSLAAKRIDDFIDTSSTTDKSESSECIRQNGISVSIAQQEEPQSSSVDYDKSLLAKLLTRNNQNSSKKNNIGASLVSSTRYENLNNVEEAACTKNQDIKNVTKMAVASTTFSHNSPMSTVTSATVSHVDLPPGIILECPFLIETNAGYVDMSVENMLNVLENNDIFTQPGKNSVKVIPKEEVISLADSNCNTSAIVKTPSIDGPMSLLQPLHIDEQPISDTVLERIQKDTEDELKDDPEAVVLTRVTDDGLFEKYVLSSTDVKALQQMNSQRRRRHKLDDSTDASPLTPPAMHIDIESPLSSYSGDTSTSLITRIVQFGTPVDNAISKLPFRKSSRSVSSLATDSNSIPATSASGLSSNSSCASSSETLLTEASFHQHNSSQHHSVHPTDHHHPHHENMFEELDSQFNMDCSIEHIQRDYVAYEEASKNETQLEHNYYANALKDEDEECVVISTGENYDLRTMMLLEQPLSNGDDLSDKGKSSATSYHQHIIGSSDVYLNNVMVDESKEVSTSSRRNGLLIAAPVASVSSTTSSYSSSNNNGGDKSLFNFKSDLILKKDALMSSVVSPNSTGCTSSKRLTNGTLKNNVAKTMAFKTSKSRSVVRGGNSASSAVVSVTAPSSCDVGVKMLPFKSVKNTSNEKKPRRTYKRKAVVETNSRSSTGGANAEKKKKDNASLNGDLRFAGSNLVEEIIVDEVS